MARARPTLSLTMMVRDEAEHIERCIASAKDVVDDIVVVDTGSVDDTPRIAEANGARVIHVPWTDDFSAPRNAALDATTTDWVLHLDADEELAEGVSTIQDLLRDRFHLGYYVGIVTAPSAAEIAISVDRGKVVRLFRRKADVRYTGIIHEKLTIAADRKADSELVICHFGPTLQVKKDRSARNTPLLEKAVALEPENPYMLAKLGDEYFNVGDYQGACQAYSRSVQNLKKRTLGYAISMMRNYAVSLFLSGARAESRKLLGTLLAEHPQFIDLYYLDGLLSAWEGDIVTSRALFQGCVSLGEPPARYFSWGGCGSWRAAAALAAMDRGELPAFG